MGEWARRPGHVLIGPINHLRIAVVAQSVRSRKVAGVPALVGHLPHRYRLEVRAGRPFDLGGVNAAIDKVVLPVGGKVVVHM